jgi:hypothetical protein
MDYVVVSILQLAFSIFKVYEIKWSYDDEIVKLTIISFLQSATWITSTAIGVGGVLQGDMWMAVIYVFFGGLGKVVAINVFKESNKK